MSTSALAPSSVLGSKIQATPVAEARVIASSGPQIHGLAIKPAVEVKIKKEKLIHENLNQGTATIYGGIGGNGQLAHFSAKGTYFGPNGFASQIPIQPKEADGSSKRVYAFNGNVVLHETSAVTAPKQQLTYDNSTGRLVPVVSSKRYKDNIKSFSQEDDINLEKFFDTLDLKTYTDKRTQGKGEKQYGLIAETFQEFPDVLIYREDENGKKQIESINYSYVNLLAVQQVKLLKEQVKALEARLAKLES